jgi:hypothetical protein
MRAEAFHLCACGQADREHHRDGKESGSEAIHGVSSKVVDMKPTNLD